MGKASSNKKVARVARTGGGRTARGRGSLLWPAILTITVVVGTALIIFSRDQNQSSADALPPRRGDHWHAAYGFYICDHFVPPIADQTDPQGIHTHGDGVVHIHPFVAAAFGKNATLGKFMDAVKGKVSTTEIKVPGQKTMKNGMNCGSDDGRVEVRIWDADAPATDKGRLVAGNPADVRLRDRELVTVAFVPEGTDIPRPPTAPQLDQLSDVPDTPNAPVATVPVDVPTTTVPGATPDPVPTTSTSSPAAPVP
jgi:hypothetical protein